MQDSSPKAMRSQVHVPSSGLGYLLAEARERGVEEWFDRAFEEVPSEKLSHGFARPKAGLDLGVPRSIGHR
jgi:hypothetical protein